jgi:hypothetical protein
MSTPRHFWLVAGALLLTTACSTPEERMAKLQLKQQQLDLKAQQIAQRVKRATWRAAPPGQRRSGPARPAGKCAQGAVHMRRQPERHRQALLQRPAGNLPGDGEGQVAAINVADRRAPGGSSVKAAAAARAYGQTITGYYDESLEINGGLQKMSWGFYSPASPEQLAQALGAAVPNFKRMSRELSGNYVRMEIFDRGGWHRTTRFDYYRGRADVLGERTLVIEASRDAAFPGSRIRLLGARRADGAVQDDLRLNWTKFPAVRRARATP